jgi:TatA/E family protein of Tat protein translocase
MFEGITPLHLLVVLIIALIILGPGKLPEVGAALGKSIREFRRSVTDVREATSLDPSPPSPGAIAPSVASGPTPVAAAEASNAPPLATIQSGEPPATPPLP